MNMKIKINTALFKKNIEDTQVVVQEKLKLGITALASYCVDNAQKNLTINGSVVTGNLRRSIGFEITGGGDEYQAIIIPKAHTAEGVYYGKYVEYGRPPIFAKNKPYMTFQIDGHWVRVKEVKAAPAKPFLAPAVEKTSMNANKIIGEVINI